MIDDENFSIGIIETFDSGMCLWILIELQVVGMSEEIVKRVTDKVSSSCQVYFGFGHMQRNENVCSK